MLGSKQSIGEAYRWFESLMMQYLRSVEVVSHRAAHRLIVRQQAMFENKDGSWGYSSLESQMIFNLMSKAKTSCKDQTTFLSTLPAFIVAFPYSSLSHASS